MTFWWSISYESQGQRQNGWHIQAGWIKPTLGANPLTELPPRSACMQMQLDAYSSWPRCVFSRSPSPANCTRTCTRSISPQRIKRRVQTKRTMLLNLESDMQIQSKANKFMRALVIRRRIIQPRRRGLTCLCWACKDAPGQISRLSMTACIIWRINAPFDMCTRGGWGFAHIRPRQHPRNDEWTPAIRQLLALRRTQNTHAKRQGRK